MKRRRVVARNRKARHEFEVLETVEAGIELKGPEVKSLRAGQVSFQDAFARVERGEVWLHSLHISPYEQANRFNVDPVRARRLLLNRAEIRAARRANGGKGPHARSARDLLQAGVRQGRVGRRERTEAPRQARGVEAEAAGSRGPAGHRGARMRVVLPLLAVALLPSLVGAQGRPEIRVERADGSFEGVPLELGGGHASVPLQLMESLGWTTERVDGVVRLRIPDEITVTLREGSPFFRWDDVVLQLADPPYREGGETYLPLQLLTDFFPRRLPDLYDFDGPNATLRAGGPSARGPVFCRLRPARRTRAR